MKTLVCLGLMTGLVFGCGDDDGPRADTGAIDAATDDGGGTDGGGTDGGGTDGGGTDGGGTDGGGTDGGGTDGGGTDGGGVDAPTTDSGGRDAPRMDSGSTGTIACGDARCDATTEQCCVTMGGASSCIGIDDSCGGLAVECDGPEDCEGTQVCCLMRTGGGGAAMCADNCDGAATNFELCHTVPDCTGSMDMCCPPPAFLGGIGDGFCSPVCIGL